MEAEIQIDMIDAQQVITGVYSLAQLRVQWVATPQEDSYNWDVALTTPNDATEDERVERALLEDIDPVHIKDSIVHAVRQFVARIDDVPNEKPESVTRHFLFRDGLTTDRLSPTHIQALDAVFQRYVAAESKVLENRAIPYQRQYLKDERFLTLYTLEALNHAPIGQVGGGAVPCWRSFMGIAFPGDHTISDVPNSHHWRPDALQYEQDVREPAGIRAVLKSRFQSTDTVSHPIGYIRQWAEAKLKKDTSQWEGATQVDARVIFTGEFEQRVYIEAKFCSDISYQTKYNPIRNQIARNIEVGLWDTATSLHKDSIDDAVIDRFRFILMTPALYKHTAPNSRYFGLLMRCYQNDYATLREDLNHLKLTSFQWQRLSRRIGWITWEDCRRLIETRQRGTDMDAQLPLKVFDELMTFYDTREILS